MSGNAAEIADQHTFGDRSKLATVKMQQRNSSLCVEKHATQSEIEIFSVISRVIFYRPSRLDHFNFSIPLLLLSRTLQSQKGESMVV